MSGCYSDCRLPIADCRLKHNRKSKISRKGHLTAESRKSTIARGFLLTELIVAMSVVGLLLGGLIFSLYGFAKFNRYQLIRQQCIAAAQAQLDSIAVTGRPIPDKELSRLWPGLTVTLKQTPGGGQWRGMQRLDVTASGKSARTQVNIRLSRYLLGEESPAEGKG